MGFSKELVYADSPEAFMATWEKFLEDPLAETCSSFARLVFIDCKANGVA